MRRRIGATLQLLGHAFGRIAGEMHDLSREQKGEQRVFDMVLFMRDLPSQEWAAFKAAILAIPGVQSDTDPPSGPAFGVPPRSQAFYCQVPAPTADAAVMRMLTLVREALKKAGATTDRLHVEATPALSESRGSAA